MILKGGVVAVSAVLFGLFGCQPKRATDAHASFVAGRWAAEPRSNLLHAVHERLPVRLCLDFAGSVEPQKFEKDAQHFSGLVMSTIGEWLKPIEQMPQIERVDRPCVADIERGLLRVVLHYNERSFQQEISQTSSPTLGVYLVGEGSLYLNVNGVANAGRDPTGGRKTILHEVGHAFGLHHSTASGAVMQANLSRASAQLTTDDVMGVKSVWQRIQTAGKQRPGLFGPSMPVKSATPRSEWANPPNSEQVLTVSLRHDSWFKSSTSQSATLSDEQKCRLLQGQKIRVKILNQGQTEAAHLRAQLEEELSGCANGVKGTVGFLYQPHVD